MPRTVHPPIDDLKCEVPHREVLPAPRIGGRIIPILEKVLVDTLGVEISEIFQTPVSGCVTPVSGQLARGVFMLEKTVRRHVFAVGTGDVGELGILAQDR